MATWKITPDMKKSCIEKMYFHKDGKTIIYETGWRWGEFFLETDDDNPPEIEPGDYIFSCGYELSDWSTDDGCWGDYELIGLTEEEQEEMMDWLEENSPLDLEERGWIPTETEMIIESDMTIERVDE